MKYKIVGVGRGWKASEKEQQLAKIYHRNCTKVIIMVDGKAHDVYKTCSYFMYRPLCYYTYHRGERS